MDNAPAVVKPGAISPVDEVTFASEAARVLMDIVSRCKLSKRLGGDKAHIMYEGWCAIAKFYGCTIRSNDATPIGEPDKDGRYAGFTAKATVLDREGHEVGSGTAYCMRDERNWRSRENFALASMAQTRAGAKAARMVFSWVVVLAGYAPTPLEEMPENGHPDPEPAKPARGGFKEFLRLMAEMKAQVGDEVYYSILGAAGVEHANEIKDRDRQVKVYKELQAALASETIEEVFKPDEVRS